VISSFDGLDVVTQKDKMHRGAERNKLSHAEPVMSTAKAELKGPTGDDCSE